jgi:alpha-tubulin suppressor-like RCC1 family protein
METKMNLRTISLLILVNLIISCGGGGSETSTEKDIREDNTSSPVETVKKEDSTPAIVAERIVNSSFAYAAIKSDGTVVTWGDEEYGGNSTDVQYRLTEVDNIYSTEGAFAALKADGTVVTWGKSDRGGDSSNVSSELFDIKEIITTYSSFAALRKDNTVISWGMNSEDGYYQRVVTDVNHLVSSRISFSAIKNDGSIVYWSGPDYEEVSYIAPEITSLIASLNFFSAILTTGEVITWGFRDNWIDNFPSSGLFNVKKVYGTGWGFLAILNDETTKYWGVENHDTLGVNPAENLANIKSVKSSGWSHAIALTTTGTVVPWGSYGEKEGVFSANKWEVYDDYPRSLSNIEKIYGFSMSSLSPEAFGALDKSGRLYLWGGINLPIEPITDVEEVVGAGSAIAVLKQDKTVEYWGNISVEIDPLTLEPKITPLLVDVASIYATHVSFSAIKEDGTIITWGKFVNDGKVDF